MIRDLFTKCAPVVALASLVACQKEATGPGFGWLRIQIATSGSDIAEFYRLDINTPIGPQSELVYPNEPVVLSINTGTVRVVMGPMDANCTLLGANTREVQVAAYDTASLTFQVSCVAVGAYVSVHLAVTGFDTDIDGYVIVFDDFNNLGVTDSIFFRKVPPGSHTIALRQLAANCTVSTDTLHTATVAIADTLRLRWDIACAEVVNRPLVFTGVVPGASGPDADIYVRMPHDRMPRDITLAVGNDWLAVWSPTAPRIAFVSDKTGHDEIYVINPDGTARVQLTNTAGGNTYPAWSPDGSRIAFVSRRSGRSAVYVMNADGTGQARVTSDTAAENYPSWASDGIRIAYVRGCADCLPPTATDVYVATGGDTTRLTGDGTPKYWPVWSPDNTHIGFGTRDSVVVMKVDGPGSLRVGWGAYGWPKVAWSPDSKQLAYVRFDGLHRVRVDGTEDTWLYGGGVDPVWSSDGSTIAFTEQVYCTLYGCTHAELWVMKSDGSQAVRLTDQAEVGSAQWGH